MIDRHFFRQAIFSVLLAAMVTFLGCHSALAAPTRAKLRSPTRAAFCAQADVAADLRGATTNLSPSSQRLARALHGSGLESCVPSAAAAGCSEALKNTCPRTALHVLAVPAIPGVPLAAVAPVESDAVGGAVAAGVSWQATLVQGLAQYLQQRSGQELTLWLEDDFVKTLCTDKVALNGKSLTGTDILPETCALVKNDPTHLSSVFAAALRDDLESFPPRITALLLGVDQKIPEALIGVLTAMRQGKPPLELIAGLSTNPDLLALCPAVPPAVTTNTYQMACGLVGVGFIASWAGDVQNGNPSTLDTDLDGIAAAIATQANLAHKALLKAPLAAADVKPFLADLQDIYSLIQSWQKTPGATPTDLAARGGVLLGRVLDSIDDGKQMFNPCDAPFFLPPTVCVPPVTVPPHTWADIELAFRATAELLQGQVAQGVHDGLDAVIALDPALPPALVQTLSLSADLAAATDADGVQAALEAGTAPLGSWRGKQKSPMISLGAFVGLAAGGEIPLLKLAGTRPDLGANAAFGAFAPVGLDFTTPVKGFDMGLFVSVLDVGQLMTSPISPQSHGSSGDSKVAQAGGSVEIAQVLAPGLYLHASLGNSPITLGAGASLAPSLRTYQDSAGDKSEYSMLRVNGFLAVDLNLIPFCRQHD
jgi:hypothetical protein